MNFHLTLPYVSLKLLRDGALRCKDTVTGFLSQGLAEALWCKRPWPLSIVPTGSTVKGHQFVDSKKIEPQIQSLACLFLGIDPVCLGLTLKVPSLQTVGLGAISHLCALRGHSHSDFRSTPMRPATAEGFGWTCVFCWRSISFFPTSLCGVLVFRFAPAASASASARPAATYHLSLITAQLITPLVTATSSHSTHHCTTYHISLITPQLITAPLLTPHSSHHNSSHRNSSQLLAGTCISMFYLCKLKRFKTRGQWTPRWFDTIEPTKWGPLDKLGYNSNKYGFWWFMCNYSLFGF